MVRPLYLYDPLVLMPLVTACLGTPLAPVAGSPPHTPSRPSGQGMHPLGDLVCATLGWKHTNIRLQRLL